MARNAWPPRGVAPLRRSLDRIGASGAPCAPIARRIGDTCCGEALPAQAARIACAAGAPFRVGRVARNGGREIYAEAHALAHDVGLAEADQRRVHVQLLAFDAGLGRE